MIGRFIMKLGKVKGIKSLGKNFREYQRCVNMPNTIVTPSRVRAWYYAPALNMVGASRFIGYEGMTCKLYNNKGVEIDGRETERWLQASGWFEPLGKKNQRYSEARKLAEALSKNRKVFPGARFNMLKPQFDSEIRDC